MSTLKLFLDKNIFIWFIGDERRVNMEEDYKNIFTDLLLASPLECINMELTPLEKVMAKIIPFKGYLHLTDSQKIMIMQSIKLVALTELNHHDKLIKSSLNMEENDGK